MEYKRKLERALKSGKDLELYLPSFLQECASTNQLYAGMSFVMHYYDLYESMIDEDWTLEENEKEKYIAKFNDLVSKNLLEAFDGEKRENAIKTIHQMRVEITEKMQILTAYTDRFLLYEYVLNRLELKFEDSVEEIDEEAFSQELLAYIFNTKDNVVINTKIQEMLSQIPIRMTKGRFFDLLHGSLLVYMGMDIDAVEDYIYMLRCAAGVYQAKGEETCYPRLKQAMELFKETDYRELSKEVYAKLSETLEEVSEQVRKETSFYYNLQELCNMFYALLLNYPYASAKDLQLFEEFVPVIKEIVAGFRQKEPERVGEETVQLFEKTEGKIEELAQTILKQQGMLHEIKESYLKKVESMMLGQLLECTLLSEKLLSNSLFIELDPKGNLVQKKADRAYLEERIKEVSEEFAQRLKEQPQMLNRAMMAGVLKEMPVFFQDQKEVLDYIQTSFSNCRDKEEKIASIRLMRKMMKEEV